MAGEPGPYPEFSWSQTRRGTFRECPRLYYYSYYAPHGWWLEDASEETRTAARLKRLTNLHLLAGGVIHDLAARAILAARGGREPPAFEALLAAGRRRLNLAWAQSQRRDEWERRPRELTMLHEFYYGTGPSGRLVERIRDRLSSCLRNLLASPSYREAVEAPYVEVKEADRMDTFLLDGHRIYAQPDLLYRRGDGGWRLVDWKTGEERDSDLRQLRAYAVYLLRRPDLEPGPIVGCLEYLAAGERQAAPITTEQIEAEELAILDSIGAMRTYLADPERNAPLPREAFPLRSDTAACPSCNFWELCREEIEGAAQAGPF